MNHLPKAERLLALGCHVVPIQGGDNKPYGTCAACKDRGCHGSECPCHADPLNLCHGMWAASSDLAVTRERWAQRPRSAPAIHIGRSNLVCIDIDAKDGKDVPAGGRVLSGVDTSITGVSNGFDVIAALCELRGQNLPWIEFPTFTVTTPSGGMHIWYRVPDGHRWSSGDGLGGGLGWQVDIKAGASLGLMPGCQKANGGYDLMGSAPREFAPLPLWIAKELIRNGRRTDPPSFSEKRRVAAERRSYLSSVATSGASMERRFAAALARQVEAIECAPNGERNSQVNKAAYTMSKFAENGAVAREELESLLTDAAVRIGLHHREAVAAVRSGLKAGSKLTLDDHSPIRRVIRSSPRPKPQASHGNTDLAKSESPLIVTRVGISDAKLSESTIEPPNAPPLPTSQPKSPASSATTLIDADDASAASRERVPLRYPCCGEVEAWDCLFPGIGLSVYHECQGEQKATVHEVATEGARR